MRAFIPPQDSGAGEMVVVFTEGQYRPCVNWLQHKVCNWLVSLTDNNPFCQACRMNDVIPDLTVNGNLERWRKMELGKRRCLYTLQYLSLPLPGPADTGATLRFRFLAESPSEPFVATGHDGGLITVNIAEADDDERARRRIKFREPYRTVVGHFRHELGHYYWDHLIANTAYLTAYRQVFGDETGDYEAALQSYYQNGPKPEYALNNVTAYASSHPWEDWAETWAHYMHIIDMMETASAYGLVLGAAQPQMNAGQPAGRGNLVPNLIDFEALLNQWIPLTCALNTINRGMGLQDLYPFALTLPVCSKLRFIHDVVQNRVV